MGRKGRLCLTASRIGCGLSQPDSPACRDMPTGGWINQNEGMIEILRRYYYVRSSNFEPQADILEMPKG
jgi:hypothetical protein